MAHPSTEAAEKTKKLAEKLRELAQAQGLSTSALAKRAGLRVGVTQRLLSGTMMHPSLWTVLALAKVLGIDLNTLVAEALEAPPAPKQRKRRRLREGPKAPDTAS